MDLYKEAYFGKSFMMIGDSLTTCLGCTYCRATGPEVHYRQTPSSLNPEFRKIPVAVNLFYGDPMLQVDNTIRILEDLKESGHTGPVIIITKGDLRKFPEDYNYSPLDLHFGLSTFGINDPNDGGTVERFKRNLETAKDRGYKFSIEFRPIVYQVNSGLSVLDEVLRLAESYETGVGYCGLQVTPEIAAHLPEDWKPFPGRQFGLKKSVSDQVHWEMGKGPSFRKTSCLIAWKHGLDRDPNAHYYRPNEVGCFGCPMEERCMGYKESLPSDPGPLPVPFEYEVVEAENYVCGLVKAGLCKFPSEDCRHISGKLLRIAEPLTTTDIRLIKWLTGYTVEALGGLTETPFMSTTWIKKKTR